MSALPSVGWRAAHQNRSSAIRAAADRELPAGRVHRLNPVPSHIHSHPLAASRPLVRDGWWGTLLVGLAGVQGLLMCLWPSFALVAVGLWWNSNTVSHNAIHRPFFTRAWLNRLFSFYLTALLGIPQTVWRERHLAHHAGRAWRPGFNRDVAAEVATVLAVWTILIAAWPSFFFRVYMSGYIAGLALCWLHGHYEHARGTMSHYGRLYNWLFLNDGYHVEHHTAPGLHWRQLPQRVARGARGSRWPAVLRWIEPAAPLDVLERLVLKSAWLQRLVAAAHERAFRRLLPSFAHARSVAIVGGGLFPRTALVLQQLLPEAELVLIDADDRNLRIAHRFLRRPLRSIHAWYDPMRHAGFDLVVIPLAYIGDRREIYKRPPASAVLVHDWLWRRRGKGTVISLLLLKRLNLVQP